MKKPNLPRKMTTQVFWKRIFDENVEGLLDDSERFIDNMADDFHEHCPHDDVGEPDPDESPEDYDLRCREADDKEMEHDDAAWNEFWRRMKLAREAFVKG